MSNVIKFPDPAVEAALFREIETRTLEQKNATIAAFAIMLATIIPCCATETDEWIRKELAEFGGDRLVALADDVLKKAGEEADADSPGE